MRVADLPTDLAGLASHLGVQPSYWDTKGELHVASPDAVTAVLRAMGVELDGPGDLRPVRDRLYEDLLRPLPPVVVVWEGDGLAFDLCTVDPQPSGPLRVEVETESGAVHTSDLVIDELVEVDRHELDGRSATVRRVVLAAAPGCGYHDLRVELGAERHEARVIVAPRQVLRPGPHDRVWGVFAPVYSLRAELGIGPHVGDLQALAEWVHPLGGRLVGTLPLLATYLDRPFDPSPYAPVSRCFWNELYLDLERVPEMARSPRARSVLDAPQTQREIAELRALPQFDHRRQARLARAVLAELAATFALDAGSETDAFEQFLAERPDVREYARFRALVEATGTGWHAWPERARDGRIGPGDYDQRHAYVHLYAQFAMYRQMGELSDRLSERDQRLYLDLPVGAHGDGFDTWRERDLFAWGIGTGAPPDDFFTEGQNWGFPPVRPDRSRATGHRHFRDCVRHHMQVAGMLRIDHVMQLHRLYWVPDGMGARDGVYVHNPREELFAVLTLESHRSGCLVVGEDLGTVPDEIRDAMERHRLTGMYVAQFQLPTWPGAELATPAARSMVSLDTHDTPTFTGFLRGLDIAFRHEVGLLDDTQAAEERAGREQAVANLVRFLADRALLDEPGGEHEVLRGVLRFLGESDAEALLLALDDLWGETDPHNVPGTPVDRPNWVQRMADSLAVLADDREVRADLELVQRSRLAAHGRSRGLA